MNKQKHTLFLRRGDFEALGTAFPKKGASYVIRQIVSQFVDKLDRPLSDEELESIDEEES